MPAFQPRAAGSFIIANAVAASTPIAVSFDSTSFLFYNTSTTATAFVRLQEVSTDSLTSDPGTAAVIPTTASGPAIGDVPIPPGQQVLIGCGEGHKRLSVIASAADGNLYVTPGEGI